MRKLFWCSLAVAVAAAGSVYLASKSVERSPAVVLGQALINLGGEEPATNETGGTGIEPGLPEPVPVGEVVSPTEAGVVTGVVVVAEPSAPGHIFIEEDPANPAPGAETTVPVTSLRLAGQQPVPLLMPYCSDGVNGGLEKMPYAEEEECEPQAVAGTDEVWDLLRQVAREAVTDPMTNAEEARQEEAPVCPATHGHHGYHDHCPVCPHTGRSCPEYRTAPPAPVPEIDTPPENNNQKKEPMLSESKKATAAEEDEDGEEQDWPNYQIDTMEFRPSDAGFQPILPRPF